MIIFAEFITFVTRKTKLSVLSVLQGWVLIFEQKYAIGKRKFRVEKVSLH